MQKKRNDRVVVPYYAKISAKLGLMSDSGMSKTQARKLNIRSGIKTAQTLVSQKTISPDLAKAIARFYLRFKGQRSKRSENAINLWGGRRFGLDLARHYYK